MLEILKITQEPAFWSYNLPFAFQPNRRSSLPQCLWPSSHKMSCFYFAAERRPQPLPKEEDGKAICLQQDRNQGQGGIWVCPVPQLVHQHLSGPEHASLPGKQHWWPGYNWLQHGVCAFLRRALHGRAAGSEGTQLCGWQKNTLWCPTAYPQGELRSMLSHGLVEEAPLYNLLPSQPLSPLLLTQRQPNTIQKNPLVTQLLWTTTKLSIYVFIDRVVYLIQGNQRQQHLQYLWNQFSLNSCAVCIKFFHQGWKYKFGLELFKWG